MGQKEFTTTVLATELAAAALKDDAPEHGGHDISAGMYGPNVSAWLRALSEELCKPPADELALRDRFAIAAMRHMDWVDFAPDLNAGDCWGIADAMFAARGAK
jgi:hypothetical protein